MGTEKHPYFNYYNEIESADINEKTIIELFNKLEKSAGKTIRKFIDAPK
jgi:hypothetical protein